MPPHYDSLIAKLVVHGATRAEAIARLRRSLAEMVVDGIHTTLPLHRAIVEDPEFQKTVVQQNLPLRVLGPDAYRAELLALKAQYERLWAAHPWKE